MEHAERQQWVEQLAQINTRLNASWAGAPEGVRDG